MKTLLARFGTLLALGLAACTGPADAPPTDAEVQHAETLRPADAQLAAKYERSCMLCHGVRGAAPLAGHSPSWRHRLAQGRDTLLSHVRNGFNAMPAMGYCGDCSDDELRRLIDFMSQAR
jgi:cytochrome c5